MKKKHRLIFFGSPDFALPPLKTLYLGGYEIVGVYTQEPKKKSRGMKELKTPIHLWAESQLLPVYSPSKLDKQSLEKFKSLKPDVAILFAYGKIIPPDWLNIPIFGFINIHASLLPRWRGAAPVQRAIENNDKKSGITIMKMNEGLDEGPIIEQDVERVNHRDTTADMTRKGNTIESNVLAKAVRWHAEKKILLNGSKTIVFS